MLKLLGALALAGIIGAGLIWLWNNVSIKGVNEDKKDDPNG